MDEKVSRAGSFSLHHGPSSLQDTLRYDEKTSAQSLTEVVTNIEESEGKSIPIHRIFREFGRRSRPIRGLVWTSFVFALFACLYCLFVYFVLIRGQVIVGKALFDASTTNLLVSIFSQISALLADTALRQLLAALRMYFAAQPGGLSAYTWFGIGPSSQWLATARFAVASYLLNAWCLFRYAVFNC
jgi:hypothetical protein